MKLIIEISAEKYEWFRKNIKNPDKNSTVGAVALGVPYEEGEANYCSCLNCKNQHTTHCEPQNKKTYGYCGNWERR